MKKKRFDRDGRFFDGACVGMLLMIFAPVWGALVHWPPSAWLTFPGLIVVAFFVMYSIVVRLPIRISRRGRSE